MVLACSGRGDRSGRLQGVLLRLITASGAYDGRRAHKLRSVFWQLVEAARPFA